MKNLIILFVFALVAINSVYGIQKINSDIMSDKNKALFSEFPPVTTEQWMERVTADLKGADFDKKLVWKNLSGIKIQPAYNDFLASCKSAEATYEVDHDASKYKGGEKPGKRIVYGRGAAKAANDEYYFRVADGKFE